MAGFEQRLWEPNVSALTRDGRSGGRYRVYRPDLLVGRRLVLDADVAADVADAERELVSFNAEAKALADTEALGRLLLRAESVASSRIEGLEVGSRRLLRAGIAQRLGAEVRDATAAEVLANIDAMVWAVASVNEGGRLDLATIVELHRRLMANTRLRRLAGLMRDSQNWIGGSYDHPLSADFVPPPPEAVAGLLDDLLQFCNGDCMSPLAQAAVAHAQFETIHPFGDGNGRAGRALVHMMLRRRGIAESFLPPVSLVIATRAEEYVERLMGTRYDGEPDSDAADAGLNAWVAFFAGACRRAMSDAREFEEQVRRLQAEWMERACHPRRGSTMYRLIGKLPAMPMLTVRMVQEATGRSYQAANDAVGGLERAGVLEQVSVGRGARAFVSPELVDVFTGLERRLASPDGDTRRSPPVRRAPARRTQ